MDHSTIMDLESLLVSPTRQCSIGPEAPKAVKSHKSIIVLVFLTEFLFRQLYILNDFETFLIHFFLIGAYLVNIMSKQKTFMYDIWDGS